MLRAMTGSELRIDAKFSMMRALMIFAILNRYARVKNPLWMEWMDWLAKRLINVAIRVEDRAYYPMQRGIKLDGTWHFMLGSENLSRSLTRPRKSPTQINRVLKRSCQE